MAFSPGDPGSRARPRPSQCAPRSQDALRCPSPLLRSPSPTSHPNLGTRGLTPVLPVLVFPASSPQRWPCVPPPPPWSLPAAARGAWRAPSSQRSLGRRVALYVLAATAAHTCAGRVLGRTGPRRHELSVPGTSLGRREGFEMRSFQITQVDPERSKCPYKRQDRKDTRRKGHVPTEAEAGELQPQTQGHLEPPEAGRAGRPRPGALGHLDFRLCPADSERRHLSSLAAPTGGLGPGHSCDARHTLSALHGAARY